MSLRSTDGLFLHASSVVVEGGAMLFLGHSTAGKSTIARLAGQTWPVLADDSVFVSRDAHGAWRVVNGSFRFEEGSVANWEAAVRRRAGESDTVRLLGCCRIHKALGVKTAALAPASLARVLMDAVMEVDMQRKLGRPSGTPTREMLLATCPRQVRRNWFRQVAEIARTCPGWRLWFPKDSHGPELRDAIRTIAMEAIEIWEVPAGAAHPAGRPADGH